MLKALAGALIVGGLVLLYFGWNEYSSLASEASEALTGSPSDDAVLYLAGGAAAFVGGVALLFTKGRR